MGRVDRVINADKGEFPYYVEVWSENLNKWESEVRYYMEKQDERDYPDSTTLRKFKYLGRDVE